jgi:hypothetical protein
MLKTSVILSGALGCLGLFSCGGSEEDLVASCQKLVDSPRACTRSCFAAQERAQDRCSSELSQVTRHALDYIAAMECTQDCDVARTCPPEPLPLIFVDCTCAASCIAAQSESFEEAFEKLTACTHTNIETACFSE